MTVQPQPRTGETAPRRWSRLQIGIVAVLLSLLLVRAALPLAAAWAARWAARTYLGLDADVRNVDLELVTGWIAFEGMSVTPPREVPADGAAGVSAAPLLTWERVAVDFSWRELLAGRLHLTEVSILAPSVRIARQADGSLDPFAGAAPTESTPNDDGESGMPVEIDRVAVQSARLQIVESADESELLVLELGDVAFDGFDLAAGEFSFGEIDLREPRVRIVREFVMRSTRPADQTTERVAETPEGSPVDDAPEETAVVETTPATTVVEATEATEATTEATETTTEATEATTAAETPEAPAETRPLITSVDIERAEFALLIGDREVKTLASFHAERIGRDGKSTFPLKLSLEADEGSLELSGEMALSPFVFVGDLRWKNFPIPLLSTSLRPDLAEWILACRAGGDVSVDVDLRERPERNPSIRIAGNADVSGLEVADPRDGALSFAWKDANTKIEELTIPIGNDMTEPLRILLTEVHIDEPNLTYTHPSDALERLLVGPQPEVDAEAPAETEGDGSRPLEIRLSRVELRNGSLEFTDENVTPKYEVTAREFTADLRGMSLGGPVTIDSVAAAFRSRGNTRVRIEGRLRSNSGAFEVDLDHVALPPINGYAATAGIEVVQGALSSESKVRSDAAAWIFDNDVTLHDLKLDPKGSGGFRESIGMPTDVMLALLRDPRGNISLPVEFSIGRGETGAEVSSSIASALRQALVGAASIPLKGVGKLFRLGTGGMRVEAIPAEPGFPILSPGAEARVSGLAGLLDTRPRLGIVLVGSAGDDDRDALAMRILGEDLDAGGDLPDAVDADAGFFARRRVARALRARANGEESPLEKNDEELLEEYVEATEVPEGRFSELAQQRARRVREDLVTTEGVPPERIRISDDTSDDDPGVEIEFFLVE